MKVQSFMPSSYIYETALHPPPPTPITFMAASDFTQSLGVISILFKLLSFMVYALSDFFFRRVEQIANCPKGYF